MPSLFESMGQHVQIDICSSIVDDITREEMLHITSNKSEVTWTETERRLVRLYIAHKAMEVFILNVKLIFLSKILILFFIFGIL